MSAGQRSISFNLGCHLVAGDDGGIADYDVEEFLRLYDQAAAEFSDHQLIKLKEEFLEIARNSALAEAGDTGGIVMEPAKLASGGRIHRVTIEEMRFVPEELHIVKGDTVVWTVSSSSPIKHFIEVVNILDNTVEVEPPPLPPGKSFSWTFKEAGEYSAISCVYSFMRGEVYASAPGEEGHISHQEDGSLPVSTPLSVVSDGTAKSPMNSGSPRHGDHVREASPRVWTQKQLDATHISKPQGKTITLTSPSKVVTMPASALLLSSPLPRVQGPRVPAVELEESPSAAEAASRRRSDEAEGGYDAEGEEGEDNVPNLCPTVMSCKAVRQTEERVQTNVVDSYAVARQTDDTEDPTQVATNDVGGRGDKQAHVGNAELSERRISDCDRSSQRNSKVESPQTPQTVEEMRTPHQHASQMCVTTKGNPTMKQPGPSENDLMLPWSVLDKHDAVHSPPTRGAAGGHVFRCKRCRAHFVSLFNAQRCSAMHATRRASTGTSGASNSLSHQPGIPHAPDRAELLAFWANLDPMKAAAVLDLRTPGETGELLLREVTATGFDALVKSSGETDRRYRGAYWTATRELYSIASGSTPPPLDAAKLFDMLEAASEGTFLGASVKGSLADMVEMNNLGAALALLMEGRAAAAWLKSRDEMNEAQKPHASSRRSRAKEKRRRERQRAQKKRRARGGNSATDEACGNTTTTLDEATTTDADVTVPETRVPMHGEVTSAPLISSEEPPPGSPHSDLEGDEESVNCRAELTAAAHSGCLPPSAEHASGRPTADSAPCAANDQSTSSNMGMYSVCHPTDLIATSSESYLPHGASAPHEMQLQFGSIDMAEIMESIEGEEKRDNAALQPTCRMSDIPPFYPEEHASQNVAVISSSYGHDNITGGAERNRPSLFPPNTYPLPPKHGMATHHRHVMPSFFPSVSSHTSPLRPVSGSVAIGVPVTPISYMPLGATYPSPVQQAAPPQFYQRSIPVLAGAVLPQRPPSGSSPPIMFHSSRPLRPTSSSSAGSAYISRSNPLPNTVSREKSSIGANAEPQAPAITVPQQPLQEDIARTTDGGENADRACEAASALHGLEVETEHGATVDNEMSLQTANQFFAGLLHTMHSKDQGGVTARDAEEERGLGAPSSPISNAQSEKKLRCFDLESALSIFQQRWISAEADIAQGRGRKHMRKCADKCPPSRVLPCETTHRS